MDFFKSLYHAHIWHIASANHWYLPDGTPDYRAWLRAMLYLRLDILVAKLNKSLPDGHPPLFGRDAVNHLIAFHTNTSLERASVFSFEKALLLLSPYLKSIKVSWIISPIPRHIEAALQDTHEFPDCDLPPCHENEWDPSILKRRLQKM